MTVHQTEQQTLRWDGVMSLAVLWEKYAYQDFTKKLLKQDFLRVDIGNRQQKDFY